MPVWQKPKPVTLPEGFVELIGSPVLAELLFRRGYFTAEKALAFLTGGIDVDAPGLPDLDAGVAHLAEAVRCGQSICVYGDYDTDGITSTTLLVDLLRRLGARVIYYVPNRFRDGYGMNARVVEALASDGIELIVTCDCGIRNLEEVALARELGMKVVVTDHHELGPELPQAEAVINPKLLPADHPSRMLPGVGTAYLVARQLLRTLGREASEADRWLDLVAVGIIADVVPLLGANRELARRGLQKLGTSCRPGFQALKSVAGLEGPVDEEEVAFQIVPRLNAAGRLDDASLAVRLLLAETLEEAIDLALELDQLNQERKRLTNMVVEAATAEAADKTGAILLYRPEWHEGVLGIAAGRLAEQYGVPALLMTRKQGSSILVGSARAPEGFVLHEALNACGDHLLKHGGHAAAAGFSLLEDKFPAFRVSMLEEARRRMSPGEEVTLRTADLTLPLAQVDRHTYDDLRRAAPFGEANPEAVFYTPNVQVLSSRAIGSGERHLRLVLRDGEQAITGIWWGAGPSPVEPGHFQMFYRLGLNRWKGEEILQVVVEHMELAAESPAQVTAPPAPPQLLDRRGFALPELIEEFPDRELFAEGLGAGVYGEDRYSLGPTSELILLSAPPSPRLLDEVVARSGAQRLILGWSLEPSPQEERFLPTLMAMLAQHLAQGPWVSIPRLAVQSGELETAIRLGIQALAASGLLTVDQEEGDMVRLRRHQDGRGVQRSPALTQLRTVLAESRAFRRFLRSASPEAIALSIHLA